MARLAAEAPRRLLLQLYHKKKQKCNESMVKFTIKPKQADKVVTSKTKTCRVQTTLTPRQPAKLFG